MKLLVYDSPIGHTISIIIIFDYCNKRKLKTILLKEVIFSD
jgi:hypothetical protein